MATPHAVLGHASIDPPPTPLPAPPAPPAPLARRRGHRGHRSAEHHGPARGPRPRHPTPAARSRPRSSSPTPATSSRSSPSRSTGPHGCSSSSRPPSPRPTSRPPRRSARLRLHGRPDPPAGPQRLHRRRSTSSQLNVLMTSRRPMSWSSQMGTLDAIAGHTRHAGRRAGLPPSKAAGTARARRRPPRPPGPADGGPDHAQRRSAAVPDRRLPRASTTR